MLKFRLPLACKKTSTPYGRGYNAVISGKVPAEFDGAFWMIAECDLPALAALSPRSRAAA